MAHKQDLLRGGAFLHTRHLLTTSLCLLVCVLAPVIAQGDIRRSSSPILNLLDVDYESALVALEYGQYIQADLLLRRVIEQDPANLGAYLDLAVVACRRGDKASLTSALDALERHTHGPLPEGIAEVVAFFRESPCKPLNLSATAHFIQLSAGHSSNANLAPEASLIATGNTSFPFLQLSGSSRPQRSAYAQASAAVVHALSPQWEALSQVYLRQYLQDTDADAAVLSVGVAKTWNERRVELSAGLTMLDHSLQQKFISGRLLQGRNELRLNITQRTDIDDNEYRAHWMVQVSPAAKSWRIRLGPLVDFSKQRPGGNRAGLELQGEVLTSLGSWRIYNLISTQLLLESSPYSPIFGNTKRRTHQSLVQTRWEWSDSLYAPYMALNWLHQRDQIELFNYHSVGVEVGMQFGR